MKLQTVVSLLVCSVVIVAMLVTHVLIGYNVSQNAMSNLENKTMNIARTFAYSPTIIEAMSGLRPEKEIQEYAKKVQNETDVNYIVVFDMEGIRKSHPDENKIGLPFVGGDEGNVLKGEETISIAKGTLGEALRAFTPIYSTTGEQIGAVAVGISLDRVNEVVEQSRSIIYIGMLFGTIIGIIGAVLLAKRIKKVLLGLEPNEIARVYEERNGMIQSMFEGVIAINENSYITLANTKAIDFLNQAGLEGDPVGKHVDHYFPILQLSSIVSSGEAIRNYDTELNGVSVLINSSPLYVGGGIGGAIVTFRDKTEIKKLAEQLTGVKMYADALRAQTHEFMNKLHVILGMVHLKYYDEISPYVRQLKDHFQEEIGFISKRIKDPILAGFMLGKMSDAREKGVSLTISEDSFVLESEIKEINHNLVTIVGNLIDNAFDAIEHSDEKMVYVLLLQNEKDKLLTIEVSDTGQGMSSFTQKEMFEKGFTTKKDGRGYGLFLIKQIIEKLEGDIKINSEVGLGTTFSIVLPYNSKDDI